MNRMQYVNEGGTNNLLAQYSWDALSRAQSIAYVECPAVFVPVSKQETGMEGALNGAEEEVYAGADREPASAS
jgi:hypothetical protein